MSRPRLYATDAARQRAYRQRKALRNAANVTRVEIVPNTIYCMDALTLLRAMPSGSVNCIVTSPPYFGLRSYTDGDTLEIGKEQTPAEYVKALAGVFSEARRVLRDDGTLWLNLGDTYTGGGRGATPPLNTGAWKQGTNNGSLIEHRTDVVGLPSKSLIGIPFRVAFALQDAGWILRADIVWSKPNPMPESVTDRPAKAHEYVFLLAKSEKYWYDAEAVKEPCTPDMQQRARNGHTRGGKVNGRDNSRNDRVSLVEQRLIEDNGRNKRSVWTVPTTGFPGAHFATFPEALIEPMILAGCPVGGLVLDCFMGAGTTAVVARKHGRNYIGSELNADYIKIAQDRLRLPFEAKAVKVESGLSDLPLFAKPA